LVENITWNLNEKREEEKHGTDVYNSNEGKRGFRFAKQ